jgi:xanthine dehydrogenase YagT iron-sulfur-binding subunit
MRLTVNGSAYDVDAPDHETLLTTLRERLHLSGTKLVCGRGECGACSVHLDGALAYACLTLTRACQGVAVTTIEGVGRGDELHSVQEAFIAHDALQCGFCTPGQIMAALALLQADPRPSDDAIRRGMSGNLCRCGAYPKILAAVRAAAAKDKQT